MTHRERAMAVLNYQPYDRMPLVHFGFWDETYTKFEREGHIHRQLKPDGTPGGFSESAVFEQLGFDFGWGPAVGGNCSLCPGFEGKVVETFPDGSYHVLNGNGVVILQRPGATSIPSEVSHLLTDRESFERDFRRRLEWTDARLPKLTQEDVARINASEYPVGLATGSLYGTFRDIVGVVGMSYMYADDEELFGEILIMMSELCYRVVKGILDMGVRPDFGHYWEDICFKNGPLVNPVVFEKYCAPGYRRISDELAKYGCRICSLDCDGCIDKLVPIWLANGVNTMFPIEVGTWGAEISTWRKQYGRELRGVGGMDKRVFAQDYAAIDKELERLRRLTELGGYIPCPDHRIPPDAKWENIQYYADRFRKIFG